VETVIVAEENLTGQYRAALAGLAAWAELAGALPAAAWEAALGTLLEERRSASQRALRAGREWAEAKRASEA